MLLPQKQKSVRTNNSNQNQTFAERIRNKYLQTGSYPLQSVSFIWRQGSNADKYSASDSLMVNLKLILETKGADHQKIGGRLFRHLVFLTGSQGAQFFSSSLEKALRPFLLNQQLAGKNNEVSNTRDSLVKYSFNESTPLHVTNKAVLYAFDYSPSQVYLPPESRAILLKEPWILDRLLRHNTLKAPVIMLPGADDHNHIVTGNFGSGPERQNPSRSGLVPASGNHIRWMISRRPRTTGTIARTSGERYRFPKPGSALTYKINHGITRLGEASWPRTGLASRRKDTSAITPPPGERDDYKQATAEYYKFNHRDVSDMTPGRTWPDSQEGDGIQQFVQPSPDYLNFRHRLEIYRPWIVKRILSDYPYHPGRQTLTRAGQRTIQRTPISAANRSYPAVKRSTGDLNNMVPADTFGAADIFRLINRTSPGANAGRSISPWSAADRIKGSDQLETGNTSSVIRQSVYIQSKHIPPDGLSVSRDRNDYSRQLPASKGSGTNVRPVNLYFGQLFPNEIKTGMGGTEPNQNRDHQVRAAVAAEWFHEPAARPNGHALSASQGKEYLLTDSGTAAGLSDFTVGVQRHGQGLAGVLAAKRRKPIFDRIEKPGINVQPSFRPIMKNIIEYPAPEYPGILKTNVAAAHVLRLKEQLDTPLWALSKVFKANRNKYAADQGTTPGHSLRGRIAINSITDRYYPGRPADTQAVLSVNSEPHAAIPYNLETAKKNYWLENQPLGQPEIEINDQQKYKAIAKAYLQQGITIPADGFIQQPSFTPLSGDNGKQNINIRRVSVPGQRLVQPSKTSEYQKVAPESGASERLGLTVPSKTAVGVNPARLTAKWPNVFNFRNRNPLTRNFLARYNQRMVPAGSPLSVLGSRPTAAMIQRKAGTRNISPAEGRYNTAGHLVGRWLTGSLTNLNGIVSKKSFISDQRTGKELRGRRKAGTRNISPAEGRYSTAEYPVNRWLTGSQTYLNGIVSQKSLVPDQRTDKELANWPPDLSVRLRTMPGDTGRQEAPARRKESRYSADNLTFSQKEPTRKVSSLTKRLLRQETSPVFSISSGAASYPTMIRTRSYISMAASVDHRQLKRNHSGRWEISNFSRYLGVGRPISTVLTQEPITLRSHTPADYYQDMTWPVITTGTNRDLSSTGQHMSEVPDRRSDDLSSQASLTGAHTMISSKVDQGANGNRFSEKLWNRTNLSNSRNKAIGANRKQGILTSQMERPGYGRLNLNTGQDIIRHRGINNIDKRPSSDSTMGSGVSFDYRRDRSIPAETKPSAGDNRNQMINTEFMVQLPEARNVEFNSTEIRKIADRVYREIEQRMKRDRQRRGL